MPLDTSLTFRRGVHDGLPIALGYLSVSFAFGMLAVGKGLPLWAPTLISITNFTGTGQFVGIDLIAAAASLSEIAFTLLIINLRYLLMSFSLTQRIAPSMPTWKRLLIAFGVTDENFAVAMQKNTTLNLSYMAGLILSSYFGWIFGTLLGSVASSALPLSVRSALGIAIYAMFVAIIIPPAKTSRPILLVVLIGIALSCLFTWVPGLSQLSSGWVIIICGVVSSAIGAFLFPVKQPEWEDSGQSKEKSTSEQNPLPKK